MSSALQDVVSLLREAGITPMDARHLVSVLESSGWSDHTARQYGYESLFSLAGAICPEVAEQLQPAVVMSERQGTAGTQAARHAWHFLRGMFFAMPMVVAGWASLYYGRSLWSYSGFGVAEATGIALATVLSFLATAGMTQAISRRGLFLISIREYALARRTSIRMVTVGVLAALAFGLLLGLLLTLMPVLSWPTVRMIFLYYPFLCLIWLFLGLLYMLQREFAFVGVVAVGVAIVIVLGRTLGQSGPVGWSMILVHMLAMSFVAVASLLLSLWFFRRMERRGQAVDSGVPPFGWAAAVRQLYPFFLYGTLYFAFLFLDRLLAWSTPNLIHPQAIWFLGPYELGLDWAILVLVLPMGAVEMGIWWLVEHIYRRAAVAPARDAEMFARDVLRLWRRLQSVVMVMAVVGAALLLLFMRWLHASGMVPVGPLTIPVVGWVFAWGVAGYALLAGGLFNVLILFTTNHPWPAVRATFSALATSLVVGFVASRFWYRCFEATGCTPETMMRYPQAVIGFVAGAIVLWWLAGRAAREALGRADFLLYLNT